MQGRADNSVQSPPVTGVQFLVMVCLLERVWLLLSLLSHLISQTEKKESGKVSDEDILCEVCFNGDVVTKNEIVICDMCDLAVHQQCYGIEAVPEGDTPWYCRPCECQKRSNAEFASQSKVQSKESEQVVTSGDPKRSVKAPMVPAQCCLCPVMGGALKRSSLPDGRWVHLVCALMQPHISIQDVDAVEPVSGVFKVDVQRFSLRCTICRVRAGACIQCAHARCAIPFHPLCAHSAPSVSVLLTEKSNGRVMWQAVCPKHIEFVESARRCGKVVHLASTANKEVW